MIFSSTFYEFYVFTEYYKIYSFLRLNENNVNTKKYKHVIYKIRDSCKNDRCVFSIRQQYPLNFFSSISFVNTCGLISHTYCVCKYVVGIKISKLRAIHTTSIIEVKDIGVLTTIRNGHAGTMRKTKTISDS